MKKSLFFLFLLVSFHLKAQDKTSKLASPQSILSVDYLTISLPLDRAVYQRDTNNRAEITIAGQLGILGRTNWVRYTIEKLDKFGAYDSDYTPATSLLLAPIVANGGLFSVKVILPTGWYSVKIQQNFGYGAFGIRDNTTTTKSVDAVVGIFLPTTRAKATSQTPPEKPSNGFYFFIASIQQSH